RRWGRSRKRDSTFSVFCVCRCTASVCTGARASPESGLGARDATHVLMVAAETRIEATFMHISDIFARDGFTCSFEFFPPKSEQGARDLFETVRRLEPLKPSFVSMTYGAGGSTRDLTHDLVVRLKR